MNILAIVKKEYDDYMRCHPDVEDIVKTIRKLYEQCGAKLSYQPYEFGFNNLLEYQKSHSGKPELSLDYGVPDGLHTKDGYIIVCGSHSTGDTDKFLQLFTREFDIELGCHGRVIINGRRT